MRRLVPHLSGLVAGVAFVAAMALAGAPAQAIVVDMNPAVQGPTGPTGVTGPQRSVTYSGNTSDYYGVAMVPGTDANLLSAGVPVVASTSPCTDPWLSLDLIPAVNGLCWHGATTGSRPNSVGTSANTVMHANETFTLTWDPNHAYWEGTKSFIQGFLQNVAAASGTLSSPFAVTTQYADGNADSVNTANTAGHAENTSAYAGGCVDFGQPGGFTCTFGDTTGGGTGNPYPTSSSDTCTATGTNAFAETTSGGFVSSTPPPNKICITDAAIQSEVQGLQSQLSPQVKSGYTELVNVLLPPGVEVCLTSSSTLCSANGGTSAQFCSYHGIVNGIAYTVLPWVVNTGCVEPDVPVITSGTPVTQMATVAGQQLVSPLSQAEIAAIVNPGLNGWFSNAGGEINDNSYNGSATGCVPLSGVDSTTIGSGSYVLQHEFNNAGAIQADPNSQVCAPQVVLSPTFVVPTTVNAGDTVELDGSSTGSTLVVPKGNYTWNFGDGSANATGPSVSHTYTKGGTFQITLTVTDRGGNTSSLSQTITVLGKSGTTTTTPAGNSGGSAGLRATIQLLPQSLKTVLRDGVTILVHSTQAADGIASISIPRAAARRAHIHGGGLSVVIGRGTVAAVNAGVTGVHLHVSRAMAAKLKHLQHVTITVRLMLMNATRQQVAVDAAGTY